MARLHRTLVLLALTLASSVALADQTSIYLTAYPTLNVADGRSTTSITATVRGSDGKIVPDGTSVFFQTDLGSFRTDVVQTVQGFARAVLVCSTTPGLAHITATAVRSDSVPTQITYEFVANRELLKAATRYIEVVSNNELLYSLDTKYITASGAPNSKIDSQKYGGVSIRYGDIQVQAEDVQLSQDYELKARRGRLTIGKKPPQDFLQLSLTLNTGQGVAVGEYETTRPTMFTPLGTRGFIYLAQDEDGKWIVAPRENRFMTLNIDREGISPSKMPIASTAFSFADLGESTSMIGARRAIVFPRREIQFQKAEIYVQGVKTFRVPLYDLKLQNAQPGLVTGGILTVNDNQFDINYPQYLSLSPGLSSLLRFTTGSQGESTADTQGFFLSYELNWNKGDGMDGGLTLGGIGRDDWWLGVKQFYQVNSKTAVDADVELPQGQSFLGYFNASTQLTGFRLSSDLSAIRQFTGLEFSSQDYHLGLDKDPIKMGKLPVSLTVGLTADRNENTLLDETQQGYGVRATFQSSPIQLGDKAVLHSTLTFSKLYGEDELAGIATVGSVSLARPLFPGAHASIGYTYTHDGFNDNLVGEHSFNYNFAYARGKLTTQLAGTRGLDIANSLISANALYSVSPLWSLTSTYTYQDYESSNFLDYGFGFAYKLGLGPLSRGIGLVWHYQTQRIGIQFVGSNGF